MTLDNFIPIAIGMIVSYFAGHYKLLPKIKEEFDSMSSEEKKENPMDNPKFKKVTKTLKENKKEERARIEKKALENQKNLEESQSSASEEVNETTPMEGENT